MKEEKKRNLYPTAIVTIWCIAMTFVILFSIIKNFNNKMSNKEYEQIVTETQRVIANKELTDLPKNVTLQSEQMFYVDGKVVKAPTRSIIYLGQYVAPLDLPFPFNGFFLIEYSEDCTYTISRDGGNEAKVSKYILGQKISEVSFGTYDNTAINVIDKFDDKLLIDDYSSKQLVVVDLKKKKATSFKYKEYEDVDKENHTINYIDYDSNAKIKIAYDDDDISTENTGESL